MPGHVQFLRKVTTDRLRESIYLSSPLRLAGRFPVSYVEKNVAKHSMGIKSQRCRKGRSSNGNVELGVAEFHAGL